jgi:hypothetical protein
MRTFLETLRHVVDLLMQVVGVVVDALEDGARKVARAAARAVRWLGEAVVGSVPRPRFALLVVPPALRAPDEARSLGAALVRYEQLIGWRLNGAPTSESHVRAA